MSSSAYFFLPLPRGEGWGEGVALAPCVVEKHVGFTLTTPPIGMIATLSSNPSLEGEGNQSQYLRRKTIIF